MKEVDKTILTCGCDGTPYRQFDIMAESVKTGRIYYQCKQGHIINSVPPNLEKPCPYCMNPEYLVISVLQISEKDRTHYSQDYICSNPACPRYRIVFAADNKSCSMFSSKNGRLFRLFLYPNEAVLFFRKREDNWLCMWDDNPEKLRNKKIRLLFFKFLTFHGVKIRNGRFVQTLPKS